MNSELSRKENQAFNPGGKRGFAMKTRESLGSRNIISKTIFVMLIFFLIGCTNFTRDRQDNEININGSGNLVSREVIVSNVDQVEVGLNFDLTFRQGPETRLVLTSDDNFIDFIDVEQMGSEIRFGFKPGHAYDISGVSLQAEVTLPHLSRLDLNGSSHAHMEGYQSDQDFEANLTGASSLTGRLILENAVFNAYGNSHLKISGSAANLALDACGSNIIDLSGYVTDIAKVEVACASKVILNAVSKLVGDASQHAQVFNIGDPVASQFKLHQFASIQPR